MSDFDIAGAEEEGGKVALIDVQAQVGAACTTITPVQRFTVVDNSDSLSIA